MIAIHQAKAAFFFVPRTASNSLAALLREHCGGREPDRDHHDMHLPDDWVDYTTFAVHRNPYTHLASFYRRGHSEPKSWLAPVVKQCGTFAAFVRWAVLAGEPRERWRPVRQTDLLYTWGWPRVDRWLRYETLRDDLRALPFIGDLADHLPHINAGAGAAEYDAELAGLVYGWARGDFERGGYAAESWKGACARVECRAPARSEWNGRRWCDPHLAEVQTAFRDAAVRFEAEVERQRKGAA